MISIISGKYKGRKLYHLKDFQGRPTQAKVRKSVFQILEPFDGLEVLDLYAGVGTLGIEAVSRGAERVVFIEKNHRVFQVLKKNIALFDNENLEIYITDSMNFLTNSTDEKFDIIFADPPYAKVRFQSIQEKIGNALKPGGIFCMEMKREYIDQPDLRIKQYGSTQVVFWKAAA